jgi:hypothetical protein
VQLVRSPDDAAFLHDGLEHLQIGEVHCWFSESDLIVFTK